MTTARLPTWVGKTAVAVLGTLSFTLISWALAGVSELQVKAAATEATQNALTKQFDRLESKVDRISEAVGAKKGE